MARTHTSAHDVTRHLLLRYWLVILLKPCNASNVPFGMTFYSARQADEDKTDEDEIEDDLSEPQDDVGEEEGWESLFLEEDEDNVESNAEMDQDM
jgi:hypothetical protein